MNKLTSLPVWQQYALGTALLFPWVAFGILPSNMLPGSWRFHAWPDSIRIVAIVLFGAFVIADAVIAIWYLFVHSHDDTTA